MAHIDYHMSLLIREAFTDLQECMGNDWGGEPLPDDMLAEVKAAYSHIGQALKLSTGSSVDKTRGASDPATMTCAHCGKEIAEVVAHYFGPVDIDGRESDCFKHIPIETDDSGRFYITVPSYLSMFDWLKHDGDWGARIDDPCINDDEQASEELRLVLEDGCINCPECHGYPFTGTPHIEDPEYDIWFDDSEKERHEQQ